MNTLSFEPSDDRLLFIDLRTTPEQEAVDAPNSD